MSIQSLLSVLSNPYNNSQARRSAQLTLIHRALQGDKEAALYAGKYNEDGPCPCDGCKQSRLTQANR